MKKVDNKVTGEERRKKLLEWLTQSDHPLTGSGLAKKTNVSRQVIVQDISLLKAKNHPIMATSQGYVYVKENRPHFQFEKIVASYHAPEATADELNLIVDHGVTVKDVIVEHPVYGDLTASIMVSSRKEAEEFIQKIQSTNAAYLSQLTEGLHLHTLSSDSEEKLDQAAKALDEAGFLVSEKD
ncbi:transcription repressor NadR [Metabacillus sp. GX 13764]|uniref:transcription repressor NadR n=1 Tax=Metabacillus kandeliae TaxID=2900151 RepID=UPI001E289151|nr:transcription repressor NadR [Metabacillus kandeliae]MCD7032938.1 transcription repressor NadR [Metabacillus kandeliae]